MRTIILEIGKVSIKADLYDTPTAGAIYNALPVTGVVQTWGEEIYFTIGLKISPETGAKREVEPGELGYWPAGPAFCIFFGPTPVSSGNKPMAYSAVNVFGRLNNADFQELAAIKNGEKIIVRHHD